MKILFYLHHPAHYHLFKYIIKNMQGNAHKFFIIGTNKDVLEQLLENGKIEYKNFLPKGRNKNLVSIALSLCKQDVRLLRFCIRNKPDLLVGTSTEITHIGSILKIPSLFINEDDINVIPIVGKIAYPFASYLIVPDVCNTGKYKEKTIFYSGYHELAYLHPKYFNPKKSVVKKYFSEERDYSILRFSNLDAHHDIGIRGISHDIAHKLLEILLQKGHVFITSEKKLDRELEAFRLRIDPADIHHILAFAKIFIGDSQTMAAEAGILGIPFIRSNDFVGKIGYLNELENKYTLGYGIKPNNNDRIISLVKELLGNSKLKEEWEKRRRVMLEDKIDVTAFLIWLIQEFPKSVETLQKDPDFQLNFLSD